MKRTSLFALVLLMTAAAALADSTEQQQALTLTNLMRTDELLVNAAKDGIRRAHSAGKISEEARRCAEQIDRAPFTALVVKVFAKRLTAQELETAIEFYRTEAGKRYTRYQFDHMDGKPAGQFTTGEEMRLNQFGQTKFGRQLLTSSIFEGVEEIRTITATAINDSIVKCGEPAAPAE